MNGNSTANGAASGAAADGVAAIIRVEDLTRHFQMGNEVVCALDGLSLEVQRGEFLGVAGSSGSGKSTLMYLCGGLDHATSGHIWIDGQDLASMDEDALADFRQKKIGFIFQMFNLIPTMTALENVEFPLLFSNLGLAERRRRAKDLLDKVGLANRMGHKPTQLSGGQQQRVAIARALVNNPLIILADEPTGNLDSRSGSDVMTLLRQLSQEGRTIMVVSHDPAIIAQTNRSIRLHDGQIVVR
jgi:putative ABC transport system ATP-binding protein